MDEPIRIGISRCLLGDNVRYDGGHKRHPFITGTLGRHVQFVPVCPEVECGLPVPREPIRLSGEIDRPRLVTVRSGIDHSERMRNWAEKRLRELEGERLSGFIFKKSSPSCGMEGVKVFLDGSRFKRRGAGFFARAFMNCFPCIPAAEESDLEDQRLRGNFIERVFALRRWRTLSFGERDAAALAVFHSAERLLLRAHSQVLCRKMEKLAAGVERCTGDVLFDAYEKLFNAALALPATVAGHANVLRYIQGCLGEELSAAEKKQLAQMVAGFRVGSVDLIEPLALINHLVGQYGPSALAGQSYLHPHPLELLLRYRV